MDLCHIIHRPYSSLAKLKLDAEAFALVRDGISCQGAGINEW
jgi:hypothetical protein